MLRSVVRLIVGASALCLMLALAGGVLPGCGGGGGGGATAPQISNLSLSRTLIPFMEGGGMSTLDASFEYSDPEADIEMVRIEVSDGSSLTLYVQGPLPASVGIIYGPIDFMTDTCGVFDAQVWVVDSGGRASNVLPATVTVSVDVGGWTQQTSPTADFLNDVTWNGSRFVACGIHGTIVTSDDGITWTAHNSGYDTPLAAVVWDGSRFLLVGGVILSSPDGVAWSRTGGVGIVADDLNAVAWSGSVYVTGGSWGGDSRIFWSADGAVWQEATSPILSDRTIWDIAWSGTRFVATATFLTPSAQPASVLTSTDGLTWEAVVVTPAAVSIESVTWTGSLFMAAAWNGFVYASPDGFSWTPLDAASFRLYSTASNGMDFLAGGASGVVGTLNDGLSWDQNTSLSTIRGLVWGGDKFVAVGDGGRIYTAP